MVALTYGTSSFDRDRGNFPKIPVINMFAEQAPTEEGVSMQSRPGMVNSGVSMGAGPVKALYQIDGVLTNGLFGISAGALYQGATSLGTVAGSGPASLAGFETLVFANAGAGVYKYDGTTFSTVAMPGGFSVAKVVVGASRLIVIDDGTGRFYWSDPLTATVSSLSFATAENSPDKLKDCVYFGDTLVLFGTETVEIWPSSRADPSLPFTPLVGRTMPVGIRATGCATLFNSSFAWVTSRNQVCVGSVNQIISTPSLDEKITASTNVKLWTFLLEGTQFLAVTLDTDTWVFSSTSSQWSQFRSNGQTNWIPQCFVHGYFGSSIDGRLINWSTTHDDFGGVLERTLRAGLPMTSGTFNLSNVIAKTNPGRTPYIITSYAQPTIQLRTSKDGGFTWTAWRTKPLGDQGKYKTRVMWYSLGFFDSPACLIEIQVNDPVPFRLSALEANGQYPTMVVGP